jgi:hypothetical protein
MLTDRGPFPQPASPDSSSVPPVGLRPTPAAAGELALAPSAYSSLRSHLSDR